MTTNVLLRQVGTSAIVAFVLAMQGCPRESEPAASSGTSAGPDAAAPHDAIRPEDVAANNRGVALMGQFLYDDARTVFAELAGQHPTWIDMRLNLAIATLNRQQDGDEETTRSILSDILDGDSSNLRARYCLALVSLNAGRTDDALEHFRFVAERDPADAYAAYYTGLCLAQEQDHETAVGHFERAVELDPYLRSAYYAAFQSLQRLQQTERAKSMLDVFQKLETNPRSKVVRITYTKMGPKAEVLAIDASEPAQVARPAGPLFAPARPLVAEGGPDSWASPRADRPASITGCDIDGDGSTDVFIAGAIGDGPSRRNAVLINGGDGAFSLAADHPLAGVSDVNAALWGDVNNDGRTDVYLCRQGANQLRVQGAGGKWEDFTKASGTGNGDLDTVDGALFDADHDGDLDIFCVNADGPNDLLNNNLDGTFRAIGVERGIAGDGSPSRQIIVADLDHDRDADLIVVNRRPPHEVYVNDRLWSYRPAEGFDALRSMDIAALVAGDVDADGQVELYSFLSRVETAVWREGDDGQWKTGPIVDRGAGDAQRAYQMALVDLTGVGEMSLLQPAGSGWRAVSAADRNAEPQFVSPDAVAGWAPIVVRGDRGPSLVGAADDGTPLIWDPGSGRHAFTTLQLTGKEEKANSMRSNASGIGTHIAARIGSRWVSTSTFRQSAGPGQSLQPLAIGLGTAPRIDFVAIDWSDGVFQSELALDANETHRIAETQRQLSSCPVLFAWNGTGYGFISDVLGVGGMGYMVAPGEYAPPRPWENFLLPDGEVVARDGRYLLKLGEPMEEACYIDRAALVSWDVPPGWRMTLDERMSIVGPEPNGAPRFYRRVLLPSAARNDRDQDVLHLIAASDARAAPVGVLDHRFIGRLEGDHQLTLVFETALDAGAGEPMLVIDGWVEYPYSQTMFAAWQAKADYRAPTVEAKSAAGAWHEILPQFGYPAGMPRQMSVPLPDLPPGTTRLRITTNQEVYWDRIAVAFAEPCPDAVRRRCSLADARLARTGFALRTTGPQRLPDYDYGRRAALWDTRYQVGFYTDYGAVDDLVGSADGLAVIFGPGEEVHLEFDADAPAPDDGWHRHLVLELQGWCKDMDLFTRDGETVGPLPSPLVDRQDEVTRTRRFESGRQ